MEFYIDGKLEKTVSEQPFEWYTNLPKGNHQFKVISHDHAGNKVEISQMITVLKIFGN